MNKADLERRNQYETYHKLEGTTPIPASDPRWLDHWRELFAKCMFCQLPPDECTCVGDVGSSPEKAAPGVCERWTPLAISAAVVVALVGLAAVGLASWLLFWALIHLF